MRKIPGLVPAWRRLRPFLDADYRAVHRLLSAPGEQVFQPWPTTSDDRYPQLFDEIARRLNGIVRPRVLSFGCASGEEVRALARRLPGAVIVGVDVNPRAIASARNADRSDLRRYLVGDAPPSGDVFDAILAMAVFRHGALGQHPESCAAILPFRRFGAGVMRLDAVLRPGGLLALGNAHFRLSDTRLAPEYRVVLRLQDDPPPQDVLYGPDDRLLPGQSEDAVLFAKRSSD